MTILWVSRICNGILPFVTHSVLASINRNDDDSIITADKMITDCVSDIHCIQIVNPIVATEGQVRFKLKLPFHVKTKKENTVVQGAVPTQYVCCVRSVRHFIVVLQFSHTYLPIHCQWL